MLIMILRLLSQCIRAVGMFILLLCVSLMVMSAFSKIEPQVVLKPVKKKTRFYNTMAWKKARREALRIQRNAYSFPFNFCEDCGITGNHTDSYGMPVVMSVDHIKCRRDNEDLALEQSNLTVLCMPCNEAKGVGKALQK